MNGFKEGFEKLGITTTEKEKKQNSKKQNSKKQNSKKQNSKKQNSKKQNSKKQNNKKQKDLNELKIKYPKLAEEFVLSKVVKKDGKGHKSIISKTQVRKILIIFNKRREEIIKSGYCEKLKKIDELKNKKNKALIEELKEYLEIVTKEEEFLLVCKYVESIIAYQEWYE